MVGGEGTRNGEVMTESNRHGENSTKKHKGQLRISLRLRVLSIRLHHGTLNGELTGPISNMAFGLLVS